jgi:poly(hydroxyalkanoate) synthase III subunit E
VSTDPWRAWQAWAALLATPPAQGAPGPGATSLAGSAERFAAAAGRYFEAVRSSPASAAQAAQSFADFLRDEFAASFTPPSGVGLGWGTGAASLGAAEAPALGLGREHVERARRAAAAWQRLDEAQRRLQRLWLDALREGAAAFAQRLGAMPRPATDLEAPQRLYDTWIDCAEEAYAQAAHGQAFADALADSVNAGSEWRRETQAGIEACAKLWDLPTRSELNSLAERLRSVEEAVRTQNAASRDPARKPRRARRKGSP